MKHKKLIGVLGVLFFLIPNFKVLASEDTKTVDAELYWGEKMLEEKLQEGLTHNFEGLFLSGESMIPGDSVERTMNLKNTYKYPYTITLTGSRNLDNIDKEYDLLEKINLDLTVINSQGVENKVYSGPMFEGNKLKVKIELCTLNPNEQATLKAVATLDGKNTTKEYMNRRANVDWIFRVDGDDKTSKPDSDNPDDPGNSDNSNNPNPTDNPKSADNLVDINKDPSGYNPLSFSSNYDGSSSTFSSFKRGLAKTGDMTNTVIILVLAGGSLLVGTILFKKRKVNKEE